MTPILKKELLRKSVHLLGVFTLPIFLWNRALFIPLLITLLIGYLALESFAARRIHVPFFSTLLEYCKRPHEQQSLAKGPILMVIGAVSSATIFPPYATLLALLHLFIADTLACLAGMLWGKHRLPYSPQKSWVGTITFCVVGTLLSLPLVSPPVALLLGIIGATIESLPLVDYDNLLIPLGIGFAVSQLL